MAQQGNFAGRKEEAEALRRADELVKKSKQVKALIDVILANGAYSAKEEAAQIGRLQMMRPMHHRVDDADALVRNDKEQALLKRAWCYRRDLANEAMTTLDNILTASERKKQQ